MFPGTLFYFACLAASAKFVAATPPACLLGAVNTQPNPADLSRICGPSASKVESQIRSMCGGNAAAAMSAFTSVCSSAGHQLATAKPSAKFTTVVSTKTNASSQSSGLSTSQIETHSAKTVEPTVASHADGTSTVEVKPTIQQLPGGPKTIVAPTGGATTLTVPTVTKLSAQNGTSGGPAKFTGTGAAGHVDADGFAALALAAAGLVIFL